MLQVKVHVPLKVSFLLHVYPVARSTIYIITAVPFRRRLFFRFIFSDDSFCFVSPDPVVTEAEDSIGLNNEGDGADVKIEEDFLANTFCSSSIKRNANVSTEHKKICNRLPSEQPCALA